MRVVAMLLTAGALLVSAVDATAQSGQAPAAAATGGTTNANTLSTGSSSNTNANSNSQFLSGSNTGVNNGSLEVYAGAEPYQGIILEGSTNLPQLPGIPSPPSNFSQPYRPDAFVNTPPFLPAEMTLAEARKCRDAKASWYGGSREDEASSIRFRYAAKPESPPVALTMANYVGTAMATTADGPFLAALCEAAYRAMRKGATVGIVEFNIRPKNTMVGLGFGTSGGATGLPVAGAHPYALAGTLGFGTGWSNQRVEGEVVLQLTALREPSTASTISSSSSPTDGAVVPGHVSDAPVAGAGVSSNAQDASATPQILLAAASPSLEVSAPQLAGRGRELALADRREKPSEPKRQGQAMVEDPPTGSTPPTIPARATWSSSTNGEGPQPRAYHARKRLASVRKGQSKEVVFGLFGTVFSKQDGKIVEVRGMRLRASGQSASNTRLEVSEVSLVDGNGRETPYWFLFEDGRLLTWGRPEQWAPAVSRYGLDLPYRAELRPLPVGAKADPVSGR
jgi:hypothetical protein